jgi:hypothetical protein
MEDSLRKRPVVPVTPPDYPDYIKTVVDLPFLLDDTHTLMWGQ